MNASPGKNKRPDVCCRLQRNGCWLWILIVFAGALPYSQVWAAERGEELAGEHETIAPVLSVPGSREPERDKAGAKQDRPTLKLPEVVVTGDRQYRVTAERRDLLLIDPMKGTKEMPADMGKVAVPGLDEIKGAPAAETVSAKNYLLVVEAGGGSQRWNEGRLVAGFELTDFLCILRADYSSLDHPEAFGIRPFDQKGNADVTFSIGLLPGAKVSLDLAGKAESNRQPENRAQGWGDWLERAARSAAIRSELELGNRSKLFFAGSLGKFDQYGKGDDHPPFYGSEFGEAKAEYEQDIQG
ncbi:hypothetical protein JW933_03435, partial [candidate division FCPU426 bacterium]|nr:hypothetical protein [candidate division FCPU426 bacterium]